MLVCIFDAPSLFKRIKHLVNVRKRTLHIARMVFSFKTERRYFSKIQTTSVTCLKVSKLRLNEKQML